MGRPKNPDNVKDISVFPEGYEMNAWDNNDGREVDIASSRSRVDEKRADTGYKKHRGRLYFPQYEIPADMQYIYATNTLLNEPQNDNLQELYENGYEFVKQSDHPTHMVRELHRNTDNRIHKGACVMMKKPKEDYLADQKEHVEESARKQKEISYLTDYFGTGPNDPRFVVENNGSYTPSYTNKRG